MKWFPVRILLNPGTGAVCTERETENSRSDEDFHEIKFDPNGLTGAASREILSGRDQRRDCGLQTVNFGTKLLF